jgi:hypothetical protein
MEDLPLTDLGDTERKLIAIFVRHGREGRAITMQSLAANAGMPDHSKELTTALRSLAARGLIKRAGADPIPGAPVAFRLSRPIPVRQDTKPKNKRVGNANPRSLLDDPAERIESAAKPKQPPVGANCSVESDR